MSSLIEQAAERLAQIREAGIAVPEVGQPDPALAFTDGHAAAAVRATAAMAKEPSVPAAASQALMPAPLSKSVDLDLQMLSAAGYLVPSAPRSHMADQYRVIKRPLISNAMGKGAAKVNNGNLIMMTSAMPGEG